MKQTTVLLLILALSSLAVSARTTTPDILVDTRLDYDWSKILVAKFRTLLKNFNLADPFSAKYEQKILLNQSDVGSFLPPESRHLISDFGTAVGLNFISGTLDG